jgi:hypothetical protein
LLFCAPSLNRDGLPARNQYRDCRLGNRAVGARYGLESYFVPQGEGKKIELTPTVRLEVEGCGRCPTADQGSPSTQAHCPMTDASDKPPTNFTTYARGGSIQKLADRGMFK